jgi:hypothetical protein
MRLPFDDYLYYHCFIIVVERRKERKGEQVEEGRSHSRASPAYVGARTQNTLRITRYDDARLTIEPKCWVGWLVDWWRGG